MLPADKERMTVVMDKIDNDKKAIQNNNGVANQQETKKLER